GMPATLGYHASRAKPFDDRDPWGEWCLERGRPAGAGDVGRAAPPCVEHESRHERRLADTARTNDRHDARIATHGSVEQLLETTQLGDSPHEPLERGAGRL